MFYIKNKNKIMCTPVNPSLKCKSGVRGRINDIGVTA